MMRGMWCEFHEEFLNYKWCLSVSWMDSKGLSSSPCKERDSITRKCILQEHISKYIYISSHNGELLRIIEPQQNEQSSLDVAVILKVCCILGVNLK